MAADWISPRDQLPAEGEIVDVDILPRGMDVSRAKRLGDRWWIEREIGGSCLMEVPSAPAYWRPTQRKSARAEGR